MVKLLFAIYHLPFTIYHSLKMKRSPLLVIFITVFIDLVGFGIVIPVLPFYVEGTKFNASTRMVGLLFASYSVMQLIFTPLLGRLSDKYGRRPILLISLLGTAAGFLILGFATTLWMLFEMPSANTITCLSCLISKNQLAVI